MSFGEFLWAMLAFYFIFFYFMILFRVISDLFSDHEASGWAKTGWLIFLLVLPFIALCVYLITRGKAMTERAMAQASAQDAAQKEYIRQAAGTTDDPTAQIARANDLLSSGAIDRGEFDRLKAKALA
jgi:uncharacterized membrane protein YcjF (UPF0283 family)